VGEEGVRRAAFRERLPRPGQVVPAPGDDVAHPAARVIHVGGEARDDVDVEVRDGLPAGRVHVEADVVAVRSPRAPLELGADLVDEVEDGELLLAGGVEPGGNLAPGDDQRVAMADRVAVTNGERKLVGCHPLRGGDLKEGEGTGGVTGAVWPDEAPPRLPPWCQAGRGGTAPSHWNSCGRPARRRQRPARAETLPGRRAGEVGMGPNTPGLPKRLSTVPGRVEAPCKPSSD